MDNTTMAMMEQKQTYSTNLSNTENKIVDVLGDTQLQSERMRGKGVGFHRIRRITGYLVGTVDRFNSGKRAEEHDRVKHSLVTDLSLLSADTTDKVATVVAESTENKTVVFRHDSLTENKKTATRKITQVDLTQLQEVVAMA